MSDETKAPSAEPMSDDTNAQPLDALIGALKAPPSEAMMMSRFSGDAGRRLLLDILASETVLRGAPGLAEFVDLCRLEEVDAGTELIKQGNADNDLFVIVSGKFETRINGRVVAARKAGEHIGEIALIDSTARRTASGIALERSVVLRCSENLFSRFANENPQIWRRLAVVLARRLTERNRLIQTPRTEPVIFVACSTEALPIAREVQTAFSHDQFVTELWIDGVFNASKTAIEDLTALLGRIDFAVILMTPDDKSSSRTIENFSPRDNVVFELGLAIGAIGRLRTVMLVPRDVEMKTPSDLLGIRPIDYPQGDISTLRSRLGPACNEIRKLVNQLGPI